jgi:hypothetical protein
MLAVHSKATPYTYGQLLYKRPRGREVRALWLLR